MKKRNKKGFTIVEFVIVIAAIAILATTLVPTFGDVINKAQEYAAKQAAKNAYTEYLIENNGAVPEVIVYKHANGKVVALENGAVVNIYETEAEFFADYSLAAFEMTAGTIYTTTGEACNGNTHAHTPENVDLFVFAGQSNMMGAPATEPTVTDFTDKALEYKYMPRLREQATGSFVSAQNPAGEWHYKNFEAAYGENLNDLSYKSTLNNYSANTYFCPAMSNGIVAFGDQSEANTFAGASLAPYFATQYAEKYGHSSIYAHMAKGSTKITYYFTAEMNAAYNDKISAYNTANGTTYDTLSSVSGAGTAFDDKYNAMMDDYAALHADNTIQNKCFVWLQGEGDAKLSYIEYKLKLEVLWGHLQELGFTHFFVLRVGYWGNEGILNVMKAQEDFCAENDGCYMVTRAPSLVPYNGLTTANWWINEPSAEFDNMRDSFVTGANNNHFNEKAFQLFAERSAANIHRILYLGQDPVLEEENIKGMVEIPEPPQTGEPETNVSYQSYIGTEAFSNNNMAIGHDQKEGWVEKSVSANCTNLIPVNSVDSVWIQYVFNKNDLWAVGAFYDADGKLIAPLYYSDFGYTADGTTSGHAAFKTPDEGNRVLVSDIEAKYGAKITYVRFTAWSTSEGGIANTEARIYHAN